MSRTRKIALLGAKGYEQKTETELIDCFLWKDLSKIRNVRDYDDLILDLLPIKDKKNLDQKLQEEMHDKFNIFSCYDVLRNGGRILVIGDPRFDINIEIDTKEDKKTVTMPFLHWTGIEFTWDDAQGDTINFAQSYKHERYEEYITKFKKWDYSLDFCKLEDPLTKQIFNMSFLKEKNISVKLGYERICTNRYNNGLVFKTNLYLAQKLYEYHSEREEKVAEYGDIIFLPEISVNEDETLLIVLRNFCGIQLELPEPEWLAEFEVPGQGKLDSEVRRIRTEIGTLIESLDAKEKERSKSRECLKLLYEREGALESAVRNMLRVLGAHVEDPVETNKEDGWIVVKIGDDTLEGVLEIKSTRKDSFDQEGVRQLLDWVGRGVELRSKKYKGIFIGNSSVDKPVHERPWPFSNDWRKSVELHDFVALKTEDIYVLYLLKTKNQLDTNKFWSDLFSVKGIFNMKPYWEKLSPSESSEESKA